MQEEFQSACQVHFGISLTSEQLAQFRLYYELLLSWNERVNLTTITEERDVYRKHFLDSVSLVRVLRSEEQMTLLDVGSGAGLPGLALKIVWPDLHVTLCDALQKRIHFLDVVIKELALKGIETVHGRAEELSRIPAYRDSYRWVTARAVAHLGTLSEWCLPFVKPGGCFVSMKGPSGEEELRGAMVAVKALCGNVSHVYPYTLPGDAGERMLVVIDKLRATPRRFPRKPGEAKRSPLS